ncbi:MAG: choice-of-anchor tandem repeat GloVer-containing protein [Candidatus Cybelea sp.]
MYSPVPPAASKTIAFFIANALIVGCMSSADRNAIGSGTNVLPQTSALQRVGAMPPKLLFGDAARESVLYGFSSGRDGAGPVGSLVWHKDGAFFGTTQSGGGSSQCTISSGVTGCGTVFELVPTGSGYTEKVLHRFKGGTDGSYPWAGLTDGAGSVLFGTTQTGGNSGCTNGSLPTGCGTVFEMTRFARGYTKTSIYAFSGADGFGPLGALTVNASGVIFGTTEFGGNSACSTPAAGCGTVFELRPSGHSYALTPIYDFVGGSDGANPYGKLTARAGGGFYGTTGHGGNAACAYGCGTVFELVPGKTGYSERVLYRFKGGKDGQWPKGALYRDSSGALYGTTEGGGGTSCTNGAHLNGCGTVFKLTASHGKYSERILYRFKGTNDGAWPYSSLVAHASAFYGAAWLGGNGGCSYRSDGCGTVFKLTGAGTTYTEGTAYAFKGGTDGAWPLCTDLGERHSVRHHVHRCRPVPFLRIWNGLQATAVIVRVLT